MLRLRFKSIVFASLLGIGLAACSSNSNTAVAPPANPQLAPVSYIAIGDSLTAGLGSSFCGSPLASNPACTTSPTQAGVSAVTTNYSADIAAGLKTRHTITYTPLGVSGAMTGGAPLPENSCCGDVLTNPAQVPALANIVNSTRPTGGKVIVSLLIGPNDVTDALYSGLCLLGGGTLTGGGNASTTAPCSASGTTLADASGNVVNGSFYKGYLRVLNAINAAGPDAILAIGLPDASKTPRFASQPASVQAQINGLVQQANAAIKAAIAASSGSSKTVFFDTYAQGVANPFIYNSNFFSADGYHPNDAGYGNLASSMLSTLYAAFPYL